MVILRPRLGSPLLHTREVVVMLVRIGISIAGAFIIFLIVAFSEHLLKDMRLRRLDRGVLVEADTPLGETPGVITTQPKASRRAYVQLSM